MDADTAHGGGIVVHPRITELREERHLLLGELATQMGRRDHLERVTIPNVNARLLVELGPADARLMEVQIEALRLRRHIETLRAVLAQGVEPDTEAMEAALDAEFAEWQREVGSKRERIQAARLESEAPHGR